MSIVLVIGSPHDFEAFIGPEKESPDVVDYQRGTRLRTRSVCTLREAEWRRAGTINDMRGYHKDTIVFAETEDPKFLPLIEFARQFYRTAA